MGNVEKVMECGSDLDAKSLEADCWEGDELQGFYIHQMAAWGERRMMRQVESSTAGVSGGSSGPSKIDGGLVPVRSRTIEDVLS